MTLKVKFQLQNGQLETEEKWRFTADCNSVSPKLSQILLLAEGRFTKSFVILINLQDHNLHSMFESNYNSQLGRLSNLLEVYRRRFSNCIIIDGY